ncbi:hypothetical protein [Citrobacter sp. Igbk 16]|uniref:hypothetical protein n=1 Tax=Citrobacter sp. Igbk 16 TaxID=2963958 RepID=UPI0023026CC3|nr:hypothetical protein [Citrobacter sp. Igbk 16]MDA8518974.1 hypothetical protein [Citrobacter sp. Igbk 16]
MKKYLLVALVLSGTANAYSINLKDLQDEAICSSNAAAFFADCKKPASKVSRVDFHCSGTMTDEKTGKMSRTSFNTRNTDVTVKGDDYTYYEEDRTGSTYVEINRKTGRGQLSMMDESSVIITGTLNNCRVI